MLIYLSVLQDNEEKQSFRMMYEKNYLLMYRVALRILMRQMDAENAVHEAFLSIAERFEKYKFLTEKEMTGLCIAIAKNKAIDILREEKHWSEEAIEEYVVPTSDTDKNPEIFTERKEEQKRIRKMIESLPEVLKMTIDLKYYYEYSNKEIANIMGIPRKTVEMRLYRAKIKLKEMINDEEYI